MSGIVRVALCCVVVLVVAGMLLPPNCKAREKARRIHCMGNLKQIWLAMTVYADEYDGEFPDQGLWQLTDDLPAGPVYVCPSNNDRFFPITPATMRTGEGCDYAYVGAPEKADDERLARTPVAHDKAQYHHPATWTFWDRLLEPSSTIGPWINVVFADGHVQGFPAETWDELVAKHDWILPKGDAAATPSP